MEHAVANNEAAVQSGTLPVYHDEQRVPLMLALLLATSSKASRCWSRSLNTGVGGNGVSMLPSLLLYLFSEAEFSRRHHAQVSGAVLSCSRKT